MDNDRTNAESSQDTIRRLAHSTQELAAALSEVTRTTADSPVGAAAMTSPAPEPAEPVHRTEQERSPIRAGLRKAARTVAWPVRRLLDPRFRGLSRQIDQKQLDLFDRLDQLRSESLRLNHEQTAGQTRLAALLEQESAASYGLSSALTELHELVKAEKELVEETTTVLGSALAGVRSNTDEIATVLEALSARAGGLLVGATVEQLDGVNARLLDYAESPSGFAAQRSLWFNPPIALRYAAGSVEVAGVNERIAEVPFVYRALSRVPPGASILDVGATESIVSPSLASLGYSVTAIDPRPYPLRHPNLEVVVGEIQSWSAARTFDAIVCLSTIEHIGLGAYGDRRASGRPDVEAMARLRQLSRPGTVLVFTTRFGRASTSWLERTYDSQAIEELLAGWEIEESVVVRRHDGTTWAPEAAPASARDGESVIMIAARLGR